jgi:hypothetical protein
MKELRQEHITFWREQQASVLQQHRELCYEEARFL